MNTLLVAAFEEVRDGYSADRIVADPQLNRRYVEACRRRGSDEAAVELNLALYNSRKEGGLAPTAIRTVFRDQDAYAFASEIAIRCLERKHQTTLDRILCDPALAAEFDSIARMISPGFDSLRYRWAALNLRKANRLKPELLGRVVEENVVGPLPLQTLNVQEIPAEQGLYMILTRETVLYVGEASNLRARVKTHLDHSDNKHLARYLWESGVTDVLLELHLLPTGTPTRVRRAMELELIRSRRGEFNARQ